MSYTVLHNTTAQHSAPVYMSLVHDALLKAAHASRDVSIATRNHPLPQSYSQRRQRRDIGAFSAGIIVCVAFAFIPASFAVAVVKERETGAKAQQVGKKQGAAQRGSRCGHVGETPVWTALVDESLQRAGSSEISAYSASDAYYRYIVHIMLGRQRSACKLTKAVAGLTRPLVLRRRF